MVFFRAVYTHSLLLLATPGIALPGHLELGLWPVKSEQQPASTGVQLA